jgi:hypothetical protein
MPVDGKVFRWAQNDGKTGDTFVIVMGQFGFPVSVQLQHRYH